MIDLASTLVVITNTTESLYPNDLIDANSVLQFLVKYVEQYT